MAERFESVFSVRNDVPDPGEAEEKEVVEGSERAGGWEGHGEGGQHVGSDGVLLLDVSSQEFSPTSQGELEWEVLGWGRDINIQEEFMVSSYVKNTFFASE